MRVAVLGAGYAGLTLASELEDSLPSDVSLVVVDEDGRHLVQHELHRVVRRPALADHITLDLADVLDRAIVRTATVSDVDPAAGVATLRETGPGDRDADPANPSDPSDSADPDDETTLSYDVAAVCLGATTNFYDLPGVRDHATPLKRLRHAREIRADFLDAITAGREDDGAAADGVARVVVGGAGLSGVQVAGELAALASERDATDAVEVVVLEQLDSVAPSFPAKFQRAVRQALTDRGVSVRTGTAVAGADAAAIELADGESLAYDQFVWTGGIRGSPALDGDRPVARNTLRLGDGTFVLGDAARVVDTDGEAVPASAQTAVRQAKVAATNVERLVAYHREGASGFEPRLEGYHFDSPGWLVSVGDGAVAQIGPTVLTGRAAKLVKTSVGAGYLSSVGAVANAVDLVRQELGWPGGESDEGPDGATSDDGAYGDEGNAVEDEENGGR